MVKYKVMIYSNRKGNYSVSSAANMNIYVYETLLYDSLSKRFKKYRYEIVYPHGKYNADDYIIYIYDDQAFVNSYLLSLYYPQRKIKFVDIFFTSNDRYNQTPLVIGINEEGHGTTYYTYNFLVEITVVPFSYKATYRNLPTRNKFTEEDFIARLLEELGWLGSNRRYRLVIEVNKKPAEGVSITYPKTGHNADKITVKKNSDQNKQESQLKEINSYFDKYTHSFRGRETYSGFYISLGINTVFLEADSIYKLRTFENVDVYYSKTNPGKFVIVVLKFTNANKWFTYSEFQNFFKSNDATTNISGLRKLDRVDLLTELKKENDILEDKLTYLIDQTKCYSYKINFETDQDESTYEFIKHIHKPQNKYTDKICSFLYKGKPLIKKKENNQENPKQEKFEEIKEIKDQKYKSVIVYFSKKDPDTPLIIKLTDSSENIFYYKRKQEGDDEYWIKDEIKEKDDTAELEKKIKEEELSLFTTVALLIDKTQEYKKDDFEDLSIVELTESQPEEITVKPYESCSKLKESNFNSYQHEIKISNSKSSSNVRLKLVVFNGTNVNLYDGSGLTYLYYNEHENNKFVVYFYQGDTRPLLLSYQNKCYIPKDKSSYPTDWKCVEGVGGCEDLGNGKLLETLNQVVYFMNKVNIGESIERSDKTNTKTYDTHTFNNNTTVQIKLESKDMNCFKEYKHSRTGKYPLGEIIHEGNTLFSDFKEYIKQIGNNLKFPDNVYVYYYLFDGDHKFPLLIKLEFKDNYGSCKRRYFKLKNKITYEWTLMDNVFNLIKTDELEKKLREIKDGLSIDYDKKKENLIISSNERCKEGSAAGPVAGVLVTLTLLGGGAAGVAYKYPEFFPSIYRRILK